MLLQLVSTVCTHGPVLTCNAHAEVNEDKTKQDISSHYHYHKKFRAKTLLHIPVKPTHPFACTAIKRPPKQLTLTVSNVSAKLFEYDFNDLFANVGKLCVS